ncbi:histidine phosphatase family protein [Nonomuraea thailandensis]
MCRTRPWPRPPSSSTTCPTSPPRPRLPVLGGLLRRLRRRRGGVGRRRAEALVTRFAQAPGPAADGARPDTHEVLVTHAYQIAWLVRHALDAPPSRWLGLNSGNTALTVIEYRTGLPPAIVMFNDMSHLPADLRWTGFPAGGVRL